MLIVLSGTFILLLIASMPIAFSMLISGSAALLFLNKLPMSLVVQKLFYGMDSSSLLAVPLFLLAGELMNGGGITKRLLDFAMVAVGHIKGGLCHMAVLAAMIFAGVSGSSIADAAAISSICVPMMRKEGYGDDVAVSVCAAAGCIGPVIPPSIPLVIFSSITSLSIGRLFLAGMIPGIIFGVSLMAVSYVYAVRRNYPRYDRATLSTFVKTTCRAFFALLAPVVILGGIASGIFTATEAGGIACFYCLVVSLLYREMSLKKLYEVLYNTGKSTAGILIIIAAATIFGFLMSYGKFPAIVRGIVAGITDSPYVVILFVIGVMVFLGCFVEGTALMLVLVPVFYPILESMGYDGIQFGIVFLLCTCIGALTPPVGTVFYTVLGVTGATLEQVGKTIWIFCIGILFVTLLVAFISPLSLWLPNLLF